MNTFISSKDDQKQHNSKLTILMTRYIRVNPDSIVFRDVNQGESDSVDIWAHNISSVPLQIRFVLRNDSPFQLFAPPNAVTCPGLDCQAKIKYKATGSDVEKDELKIICDKETIVVPISAMSPRSRLIPEKTNINIGNVGCKTDFKFTFLLTNIGTKEGNFYIMSDESSMTLIPSTGMILPSKSLEITAAFHPNEIKQYQFKIDIKADDNIEPIPSINVTANVVQHSLALIVDEIEISELDFQTIYFGQKRIITANIVNRGPYKRSFVVLPPRDSPPDSAKSNLSSHTTMANQPDIVFTALPQEGLLNPYGSQVIRFIFNPPNDKQVPDELDSVFNQYSSIEVVETSQKIDVQFIGKAVFHSVQLSKIDFNFDKSIVKTKTTFPLKITNKSHYLPTTFEIKPIAHFRFEPIKGEIMPNQSKEIGIVFYPKNLGVFETNTTISFCNGLEKKTLNLTGTCVAADEDKPFERTPVWEREKEAMFNAQHPDTRFAYDLDKLKDNINLRKKFDGYITESAARRATRMSQRIEEEKMRKTAQSALEHTVGKFTEEDIQEYIKTHKEKVEEDVLKNDNFGGLSELQAPDPPSTIRPAPLYLANPQKFGLAPSAEKENQTQNLHSRHKIHADDNMCIKKKFKGKATTPAEINECTRPLTPAQQLMVIASHQTISMGQISVFATVVKSFTVNNNLQQHILVTLNIEQDELSQTSPVSQVIPPRQTAGFDIKFYSKKPQNFMKTVQYTINNNHTYSFNVQAQVIPIDIQIARSIIEFRFSPDSISPTIKEFISLQNKSNSRAEFNFSGLLAPFSMPNPAGFVEANKSLNVEINYTPTTKTHDELTLVMNVVGGPSRTIKCIGDVGLPKCSLGKKIVNFGLIPIGISKTQQLRIKNSGEDDAIFTVLAPNNGELTISPMNGRITSRESQNLQIVYKSVQAHSFDIPVNINICGMGTLTFNVTGQSELPRVHLQNVEFDFGRVFVGSSAAIESVIVNDGAIPAILFLDLSSKPDFRIEYPSDFGNNNSITLVSDPCFITKMAPTSSYVSSRVDKDNTPPPSNNEDTGMNGLIYKLQIAENSQLNFSLIFSPTEVGDHSFELPITMMNVISSSSFHLQPIVSAESVQAPLIVSSATIDFGVSPIYNPQNPNSRPIFQTISLFNDGKNPLKWHFDEVQKPDVFSIEPMSGTLEFGATIIIHISFTPREATPYNTYVPLYIETEKDDNLISKVQLTGVGSSTLFRTSVSDVSLPIVPLGVKSQIQIYVVNEAFIEGSLRVQMPVDTAAFPVSVIFPEGNQLQHTTDKLPIIVAFQSNRPMSFSTLVAILDENGHAASFTVTCTTDNSVFTLYPYLNMSHKTKNNKPEKMLKQAELTARFITTSDFLDLKDVPWETSCSQLSIEFFQRYMNALVLNTQLSDFPNDFITSQGQVLMEAISNLTGGKKAVFDPERGNTEEKRRDQIKKILQYLQSCGALLSSVKPEFLLSRADFMQLMREKVTKQLLGIDYFKAPDMSTFDQQVLSEFKSSKSFSDALVKRLQVLERVFNNLSIESWMIVLMQVFKLFVVSRIDIDKFTNTPGVSEALKQLKNTVSQFSNANEIMNEINPQLKAINMQTMMSPQEATLLKWVVIYYCKHTGDYMKRVPTFEALNDSLALASIMQEHVRNFHVALNERPSDHAQRQQNAIELANAMKDLKLSFCPRADEIVDGSYTTYVTIIAYLYETLPHYLPVATYEFVTTLHKEISKTVSLTNPSKTEITYRAYYEGHNSFVLTNDTMVVGPNQTVEFPIKFLAKTLKSVAGRLSLIPNRPRFINNNPPADDGSQASPHPQQARMPQYSTPVVVDLISNVSISQPDVSQTIEGSIYQVSKLMLKVKNLLMEKCTLRMTTKIIKIADENGKQLVDSKEMTQMLYNFIHEPKTKDNDDKDTQLNMGGVDFYIKNHKPFLFSTNLLKFDDPNATVALDLEFIPITLGTFRCLIMFSDDQSGEFVYEIIARSILPLPIEVGANKFKAESGRKLSLPVQLDPTNSNLLRAVAYSFEKKSIIGSQISERKFKDMLQRRQHELEVLYKQGFSSKKYSVVCSAPQYFDMPNEVTLIKTAMAESFGGKNGAQPNTLPVVFKPTKAGEYPCKYILMSQNDIRVYLIKGIGIAATKEMNIDFNTVAGKPVKQEIPFQNPSEDTWNFKVTLTGDNSFSCPNRLTLKPQSNQFLPIVFQPFKIGKFQAEVNIFNVNKESTVIYKMSGVADEPPAEEKVLITCQARESLSQDLNVKQFTKGVCDVTTTIPIIKFKDEYNPGDPFRYSIFAPRSGIAAGTITFTDRVTKNFIWYIIEIHVNSPAPEQTIKVSTIARKSVTVSIPISNPKKKQAKFEVSFSDDDIFGEKEFIVGPQSSINYQLVVSPLRSMKRSSSIYFYSDDDGEFWYCLKIEAFEPPENTLTPLTAPIGRYASTFILLENPQDKATNFRVENDNQAAFQVMAKRVIQLGPKEKKRVEVRYIPSSVGVKECAQISFKGAETGDWVYKLTGNGKPPQPLSPTIVSSAVDNANSALILFSNPFPYPARFSVSLSSETDDIFKFLSKRKVFVLNSYNEEFQIPFIFQPKKLGQYKAHIIVASLGAARGPLPDLEQMPTVRWVYPIIGNSMMSTTSDIKSLKCRAQEPTEQTINLTLVGENEVFQATEYSFNLQLPPSYDFIRSVLDLRPTAINRKDTTTDLEVFVKFSPQRPLSQTISFLVRNPLGQEWQFHLELIAELGKPIGMVTIESLLNKTGTAKVTIPQSFRNQVPFHAYFTNASATELSVTPAHGMIEPSFTGQTELPIDVCFSPKMYGKLLKGLLVIDTLDSQFLFDVIGKTPEYVPPSVKKTQSIFESNVPPTRNNRSSMDTRKKRNIIRDNIDRIKILKPQLSNPTSLRRRGVRSSAA